MDLALRVNGEAFLRTLNQVVRFEVYRNLRVAGARRGRNMQVCLAPHQLRSSQTNGRRRFAESHGSGLA
jgi:hypothetical protein